MSANKHKLPAQWNPEQFRKLTPREQEFILHPLAFTDPVQAALAVGYSDSTAKTKAHSMRKQLMYFIMPQHEKRMDDLGTASLQRIVQEIEAVAFANEADYYDTVDVDGDTIKVLKDVTRMPEPMQRAIKSITQDVVIDSQGKAHITTSIELYDKLKALQELAEIRGGHDPRFRKPDNGNQEEAELLRNLEPEELETIEKIYGKAAARAAQVRDRKKNANAIEGTVVKRGKTT